MPSHWFKRGGFYDVLIIKKKNENKYFIIHCKHKQVKSKRNQCLSILNIAYLLSIIYHYYI